MALSKADIPFVLEKIAGARPKWYNIGLALGLEPSDLDCLRKEYRENVDDCFTQMIIAWINSSKNTKPKNWSTIATALKHKMVGYGELAAAIEEEFCLTFEGKEVRIGEKRTSSSTQSEVVPKRPRLEQSCGSAKAILKQLKEHNIIIPQDTQIEEVPTCKRPRQEQSHASIEAILKQLEDTEMEELKKENTGLKQHCKELESKVTAQLEQTEQRSGVLHERVKELSKQLQQVNKEIKEIKKLQNKKCEKKDAIQCGVSTYIPKLSPEQSIQVDRNCLDMFTALSEAKKDWYMFGCSLEVGLQFLDTVKSEYGEDSQQCLFWVVRKWLTDLAIDGDKSCKVCELIEALESELLQNRYENIVDKLDKYWHPECNERLRHLEYRRSYPFC